MGTVRVPGPAGSGGPWPPVTVLPGWLIAMLAAGVVVAALAVAVIPAVTAARSRPGPALRAE